MRSWLSAFVLLVILVALLLVAMALANCWVAGGWWDWQGCRGMG